MREHSKLRLARSGSSGARGGDEIANVLHQRRTIDLEIVSGDLRPQTSPCRHVGVTGPRIACDPDHLASLGVASEGAISIDQTLEEGDRILEQITFPGMTGKDGSSIRRGGRGDRRMVGRTDADGEGHEGEQR